MTRHLRGHSPPIELSHILAVIDRFDLPKIEEKAGPAHFVTELRRHAAGVRGWPADRIARALQGPLELPQFDFRTEDRDCPECGATLRSCKSSTRILTTLAAGTFRARELLLRCPRCTSAPLASAQLAVLAPPGQRFGYDLIAWVGLQPTTTCASGARSAGTSPAAASDSRAVP